MTFEPIVFAELVQDLAAGLGDGGSRIRLDVPPGLPAVMSDRRCLELILSNLLENALKFSSGADWCEVGARQDGGSLLFWVQDDGVGISAEQLERIFDPFYQVDSSVTRRYGGVGLGLSLVRSLVERLQGTIDVHSEPGLGSLFSVRVPLRNAEVPPPDGDATAGRNGPSGAAGSGQRSGSAKSTLRSFDSA